MSTAKAFASKVLKCVLFSVILASANLAVASSRTFPHHPWPFRDHHTERRFGPKMYRGPEFPSTRLNNALFKAESKLFTIRMEPLYTYSNYGCGDINPDPDQCRDWQKRLELAKAKKSVACKNSLSQGSEAEKQFATAHGCKKDP